MITSSLSFSINKISKNNRIFLAISIIGAYMLFLYEVLPEYLFNFNYLIYYVIIPLSGAVSVLIILPKFLSKNNSPSSANMSSNDLTSLVETVPLDPTQNTSENNLLNNSSDTNVANSGSTIPSDSVQMTTQPVIDENALQEIVGKATESIKKESQKYGETVNELKNELTAMKSNVTDLTVSFESTLMDLKSFQAELANPLNFMRKYFDSIDIKNLSDPSLPLHSDSFPRTTNSMSDELIKHEVINPDSLNLDVMTSDVAKHDVENHNVEKHDIENHDQLKSDLLDHDLITPEVKPDIVNYEIASDANKTIVNGFEQTNSDNLENASVNIMQPAIVKNPLTGSMTLGKLMNMMALMEEVLQKVDRDSIEILIDQCKMMGLKPEDEHVIYNVINMMEKSGLSVDDTLIMLYKFGKMIGINDADADLLHAKLTLNKTKNSTSGKKINIRKDF